jgi:large subunit ribosomal protein L14
MVITGTRVKVIDNSGAKEVECVRLYKRSSSKVGYAGDVFLGSVKSAQPNKKIKKGDLVRCVVTSVKKVKNRKTGVGVSFVDNSSVVVNTKDIPIGTRLLSPVMLELRLKGFLKILSMATVSV